MHLESIHRCSVQPGVLLDSGLWSSQWCPEAGGGHVSSVCSQNPLGHLVLVLCVCQVSSMVPLSRCIKARMHTLYLWRLEWSATLARTVSIPCLKHFQELEWNPAGDASVVSEAQMVQSTPSCPASLPQKGVLCGSFESRIWG